MKSARDLFEERLPPSAFDAHEEAIRRQYERAAQSQARVQSGWVGLLEGHPLTVWLAVVLFIVFLIAAAINDASRNAGELDAWYRAKLECRLSGGNYEYFGTQGYHCIGGKK